MRLIDVDAFKADYRMADECKDCTTPVRACEYDRVYTKMDFCSWLDDAPTIVPSAQPQQRWIPCDKGEPNEDMECWVTVKTTDTLYRGNFTKRYGERRYKGFITSGGFMWWNTALAWMPIYEPEPYKGEQDE